MMRLLKIELKKLTSYSAFWTIVIIHGGLFLLVSVLLSQIKIQGEAMLGMYYGFPEVWNTLAWIASWFNILLGILIIILVTNEFSFKTYRQQVMNGLKRSDLVASKGLLVVTIALYSFVLLFILALIMGIFFSSIPYPEYIFKRSYYSLVYFIQALSYMSMAFFISTLIKNTGLSILAFLLYPFVVEPMIRMPIPVNISSYLPAKIITNLTPLPGFLGVSQQSAYAYQGNQQIYELGGNSVDLSLSTGVFVSILYIGVFWGLSLLIMNRRDL